MKSKPKILLLTTGGTIATTETNNGPTPKYLADTFLKEVPEIYNFCEMDSQALMNIDSVNMEYKHWVPMAEAIFRNYNDYDGFVITHGTDTMAYTSSALSYMLQNLNKPVVITGGQKSIEQKSSDAHRNFIDAVKFASDGAAGVYIVFGRKVILGSRATKVKTKSYDGFKSVNYPYIAQFMEDKIIYSKNRLTFSSREELRLETDFCEDVLLIKLTPGFKLEFFEKIKDLYSGFVIEGFGNGGVPFLNRDIFSKLNDIAENGKPVVLTTQCLYEGTNLGRYFIQGKISQSDIIDGKDMSKEASFVKLMWALGKTDKLDKIKELMYKPVNQDLQEDWIFG